MWIAYSKGKRYHPRQDYCMFLCIACLPWAMSEDLRPWDRRRNAVRRRHSSFTSLGWFSVHLAVIQALVITHLIAERNMNPAKISPIKRLATATTVTCATPAAAYGECILKSYQDVRKDMCQKEFLAFKDCVQTAVRVSQIPYFCEKSLYLTFCCR